MPGLLADVNVQGHLPYLVRLIKEIGLLDLLTDVDITFETFPDRGLDPHLKDRALWNYCQASGLVLFTDNRNHEDEDSLNATIQDSWQEGHLPVLTLANKGRFENSPSYARRVANDVANLLFSILHENVRNQPRIVVPL
jgi:hypothetical protein